MSVWNKWDAHVLLVRVWKGTPTLENFLLVSFKGKHRSRLSSNDSTTRWKFHKNSRIHAIDAHHRTHAYSLKTSRRKYLHDLGVDKDFLDQIQKLSVRENNLDFIKKIKSSAHQKISLKKWIGKAQNGRKIFLIYLSNKELVCKIEQEYL